MEDFQKRRTRCFTSHCSWRALNLLPTSCSLTTVAQNDLLPLLPSSQQALHLQ